MKNKIKVICALLLCVCLLATTGNFAVAAAEDDLSDFFGSLLGEETTVEEETEEFVPESLEDALQHAVDSGNVIKVENKAICLQLDKTNGCVYVTDKASGTVWSSNPYDYESDELASGITRTNLISQIVVTYIKDKNLSVANNYASSILKDGVKYTAKDNSIRAEYSFVNEKFTIPVEYCITDTGFEAKVIFKDITDTAEVQVNEISVLPFFGVANTKAKGYMLIPDGSGALVNLNRPNTDNFPYEKAFYGGDKGRMPNVSTTKNQNLLLPVYGMKNGDNAFVATVTKGAENASLYASVAGVQNNYNRIYTDVTYRTYDTVNLTDAIGKNIFAKYTALNKVELPEYVVSYTLLSGDKANYVGMAEAVRKELTLQGLKKTDDGKAELFLDLYGATLKQKAFMGIRFTGVQKLTTIDQAKTILETLKQQGVESMTVGYRNFSESEYKGKIASKVVPSSKLGGKKAYKELLAYSADNNVDIYPFADFVSFKKNGNGYWRFSDVILGLELGMVRRYTYTIHDGQADKTKDMQFLVSADRYDQAKNQILKSLKKYNSTGVMFDQSANFMYNNFAPGSYLADRTVTAMQSVYGDIAKQGQKMLLSAPNAYALPYANAITDLPMSSSEFVFFDKEIPFLQIVLKGQLKYSSEALNIDGISDTTLLKLIETGSQPKFSMIYEEGKKLLGTELTNLYGATYTACSDKAVAAYKAVKAFSDKTKGSAIVGHESKNDLVKVTYANGVKAYINYAAQKQTASDSTQVAALSYVIKDKGE